jgi:Flp pilus assembly protein TadD
MTEPLCDEVDAESICEKSLQQALQIDPQNIDALQALGNLRMLRGKDKEAATLLL